jgi:hypothetical protein
MNSATERMTESEHLMNGTYNKLLGPHLRAGHSLGRTHGAYIHGSAGGDKMTGRVLCGGDLHRTTFASLPPHFRRDLVLTDRELRAIFPAFDRMKTACPSFISCLPYLLGSGAQHWDYVKSILKDYPQHVVFHTTFSRDNYASKYLSLVLLGEFECSESNLKVTGIPPTISILREIKELRKEVASLMTGRSESSASTIHDVQLQPSVMQQQIIHLTSAVEAQIETLKTTNIPQQNALLSLNSSNKHLSIVILKSAH